MIGGKSRRYMTFALRLGARRCRLIVCAMRSSRLRRCDGEGILAGAIRYWPVKVGGAPVALLGPVAVHPTRQGEGLAAMLLHRSLASARKRDWDRVLLVGDLPYLKQKMCPQRVPR